MRCPSCGHPDTRVIDSRPAEDGTLLRRRRLCDHCGVRFTTHERILHMPLIVVKKDGRREEFSSEKLYHGIAQACNKRSVPTAAIRKLVGDIEVTLRQETGTEVESSYIGELVMEHLYQLDQVAYVRFASVYQRFDDVRRFAQLLERMSRRARGTTAPRKKSLRDERSGEHARKTVQGAPDAVSLDAASLDAASPDAAS